MREHSATDLYQYLANGGGGNTLILDQVLLGVGGTRSYTYGPAGHLEEVAAGANVIDFESDAEGRLASTGRAVADVAADFRYEGRSFLTQAQETTGDPPTDAASVESIYDSAGLLHALGRKADPSDPEELVVHLYLAGRPVAQVAIDAATAEDWKYLTTDHLATPLLATDEGGAVAWEGGLIDYTTQRIIISGDAVYEVRELVTNQGSYRLTLMKLVLDDLGQVGSLYRYSS